MRPLSCCDLVETPATISDVTRSAPTEEAPEALGALLCPGRGDREWLPRGAMPAARSMLASAASAEVESCGMPAEEAAFQVLAL